MKMIIAIVQPFMGADVVHALHGMDGVTGATFTEARGFGRSRRKGVLDGELISDEGAKVRVEVVVRDEQAAAVAQAIRAAAHTGNRGDGKVFVLPVDDVMRISTGEQGEEVV